MTRRWLRVAKSRHPTRPWLVVLYPAGITIAVMRSWRAAMDYAMAFVNWEGEFINEPP